MTESTARPLQRRQPGAGPRLRAAALAALLAAVPACGRGNGLPGDLTAHLAARGLEVHPTSFHAPLSSRAGHLVLPADPALEARIVAAFGLRRIEPGESLHSFVTRRVPAAPGTLWGITGRPPELRLRNGGQLESLFLLTTPGGPTYLLSEYAYG